MFLDPTNGWADDLKSDLRGHSGVPSSFCQKSPLSHNTKVDKLFCGLNETTEKEIQTAAGP